MSQIRTGQISTSSEAWTAWTPTFTNLSGGTLNYAKFQQIGKLVSYRFKYTLGGAGISGTINFTFPATLHSDYAADSDTLLGQATYIKAGTQRYLGTVGQLAGSNTTKGILTYILPSGATVINTSPVSATAPFTWAAADYMIVAGQYEAA